jgi:LysM repeat protein
MADDATGRPKKTARRRRKPDPASSAADPGVSQTPATDLDPTPSPVVATAAGASVVDIWPMPDAGPGDHAVCPFLRSFDEAGALGDPIDAPDPANRCAALAEVVPQSLRQQELVCLTSAHGTCPRYLRGATVETEAPIERAIAASKLTPATIGALALLAAAFSASVMFMVARGGLELPAAAGPNASPAASVIAEAPSLAPSLEPSVAPTATPSPAASTSPTPMPSPTQTPGPTPSPTPIPTPTPSLTSARYALLKPCPDKPDCWIYRVRSGDNLFSIANYFGVPLATVKRLNPWTANGLRAGRDLILPPPTR